MSVAGEKPRLLVVGGPWPPQTFIRRLFTGLTEHVELLIAARSAVREPGMARVVLPPESWPRPLRAAPLAVASAAALRHPAGRRLLLADGPRRLALLQRPVDAIYFPWNFGATAHLPLMRLGLPSIVSCRGSQVLVAPHAPARRHQAVALRESFELATRVHCVSRSMVESARAFGLDPAKARVIPPAVDPDVFAPAPGDGRDAGPDVGPSGGPGDGPPWRLAAAGGLSWVKGFEDLLLAVRGLVRRGLDVHLEIAGDGPDRRRLLYTVGDLGLERRVTLLGHVAPREVRALLRRSHLAIVSSYSEGIANIALEAMACGVPVVSTRAGGMAEAIADDVDGLLVPTQDPAALEAAIHRALGDGALRQRLGAAARRRVESDFRLEDQVARFADMIFEAIRLNRSAAPSV